MQAVQSKPLGWEEWKERLDLSARVAPELYEDADDVGNTPHAGAIRTTLGDLEASAVFCVQDVPTIVILSVDEYDREAIVKLHAALWNQGLASLLLVLSEDTVRAFSLARIPRIPNVGEDDDFDRRCLVRESNAVTDALAIKDIIYGAESGRFWVGNAKYFRPEERIDQVLLNNLTQSHRLLCDPELGDTKLSSDAAQALLIQTMFIAYLEDRKIINQNYFRSASDDIAGCFSDLLESGKSNTLNRLFESLRNDFNGDLFVAPCSFDAGDRRPHLNHSHLEILARFHSGRVEMDGDAGQYRFWGYDFKYIPIELISAVYDRFLVEREPERREQGAYYTPMFLADTVISQVWDILSDTPKNGGEFLDPACGSGMFLVRSFQRLCEHWRETQGSQKIPWKDLLGILSRLRGWDLDKGAVRVAVFSLYVALLEEISPPDIRLLIRRGESLPKLWECNLCQRDFFDVMPDDDPVDVLIGNPPWSSRRKANLSAVEWCTKEHFPIPGKEVAWAFVWKSLKHLRDDGRVAFLLPAMGFLHNHAQIAVDARKRLMHDARIYHIINFSDMRFQLFEKAVRPTALIIFGHAVQDTSQRVPSYRFEYWVPKADLNLKTRRLITLGRTDKCRITSRMVEENPRIFKQRLWMTDPEAKLFNYLSRFPALQNLVSISRNLTRRNKSTENLWIIGQGFKPANESRLADLDYEKEYSQVVANTPYLRIQDFCDLVQNFYELNPWKSGYVHRKGFEKGFEGSRILAPRGIKVKQKRLRASYLEAPLTFQDIIQAIIVPRSDEHRAKLLTALLNSKLMLWFAFYGTASFGAERPEIKQGELLRLPFPSTDDMPEQERSRLAEKELVSIMDEKIQSVKSSFDLQSNENDIFGKIDHFTYEFFCLSKEESILIEDTVEKIIPAVQPTRRSFPEIWKSSDRNDRQAYANTLADSIADWIDHDYSIGMRLEAQNEDLAILRLSLQEFGNKSEYSEKNNPFVKKELSRLSESIRQPLTGNFQLMPDFRVFMDKHLYLVKPIQKRFWLRSTALADADAIALDLQDALKVSNQRNRV